MSEKELEEQFALAVRQAGGKAYKFVSPGTSGVPDRLVLLPGGAVGFVEIKAPGKKTRPEQSYQIGRIRKLGQIAIVLDDPERIDFVISLIRKVGVLR